MNTNTNLIPFAFEDNLVRSMLDENGNPWFVAKDVCNILDLSNPTMALENLDEDERAKYSLGRQGEANIISESGLYSLIFRSRKPEAKSFRKWVTSEVLPSIRKTGEYKMEEPVYRKYDLRNTSMPATAMHLRPSMRQRLWQDALQTARLDNGTSEDVISWFEYLCRLTSKGEYNEKAYQNEKIITDFIDECLESVETKDTEKPVLVGATDLYNAFTAWYKKNNKDTAPSATMFGTTISKYIKKIKFNTRVFYLGYKIK